MIRCNHLVSGITRNIFILGIISLFTDLSSQMVFPLLPLYLTTILGTGASVVGIVEGAAEATASLLKVFSGHWSDKIKRRKPFVFIGYSLSTFTKPLFAFASIWGLVLTIRIIERIGKGLRTAPRDALVAESCQPGNRGKAYGFHRAADGVGSTLGAIIAFALIGFMDFEEIFILAFIPGIISIIAIYFVKEDSTSVCVSPNVPTVQLSWRALPLNLRIYIVAASVFALGHFGYAFLLLKAKDIHLADDKVILLYVLFYVVYTICSIPVGTLSDRIGRKPILISGYTLFAVTSLGLVFADSSPVLVGIFCLYGIFFAMIDGVQRAFAVDLAPDHLKATALGTFHTAIGLTALPGGIVAGILWDKLNPDMTFIYGLALAIIATALFLFVRNPSIKQS